MCIATFALISICKECLFPSPHFQSVCVPWSEMCLLQKAYIGSGFLIHSASLCLLVGIFNPLTFKVIIDRYDLIPLYLVNLGFCRYVLSFVFPI